MRRMPPMGALEAFLIVARNRTLAASSAELNLSVSALSRRVQSLEAYIGKPLFERLHHEFRLTADGEWLLEQVTPSFDMLAQVLSDVRESGSQRLSIGVSPSFATAWLMPRLSRFRSAHPEIELSFDSSGASLSKLDISLDALVVFAEQVAPEYHARVLRPQQAFAVCAPGLLGDDPDPRAALERHPVLLHQGLPTIWPLWLEAMGLTGLVQPRMEHFDSGPMLLAAAEAGLGIALTLGDSVNFHPSDVRLERPFGVAVATPYSYWWVSKPPALRRQPLRRFHDWLFAEASADDSAASLQKAQGSLHS